MKHSKLLRTGRCLIIASVFGIFISFSCNRSQKDDLTLKSPDNNIFVKISLNSEKQINYSVSFQENEIISESLFTLSFADAPPISKDLEILSTEPRTIDESWERVWGKRKNVRNYCNELIIKMKEENEPSRKIDLIFRAYNDGIAFRYRFPEQEELTAFKIIDEGTFFTFAEDHTIWAVNYGGYASHQESEFYGRSISDLDPEEIIGLPLLVHLPNDAYAAISEADLTNWAGMYLSRTNDTSLTLKTMLSPRIDDPEVLVKNGAPCVSPWRVLMIGDEPGDLIVSDIIANLNDPVAIDDVSWIEPGKCAWDWWWCNRYAPDVDFGLGSNTETMQYFIDFASEMGWKYQLVDWHWYGPPFLTEDTVWKSDPSQDITTYNDEIDIPGLVKYANAKNVKLILWLEWNHANAQMDEAFPLYEQWGVSGVKVDFMARDDQEMVQFYHRLVKKAAEHHLVVDFHGAYKPTGFSRTYPNLITREGVLGNEYTKWSNRITPEHNVTLPFTRGLLGEMDFTPGAFVNVTRENFKTEDLAPCPMVMTTRCQQLAMLVVYESALQVICDSPYNYRNSPAGLEFLKIVPTSWDDTKVVNAKVGDYITIARISGNEWFIGSMTDFTERELSIPLDFLGEGKYEAHIWEDAPDANENPQHVNERILEVTKESTIKAKMAKGGGQVVWVKRKGARS